MRATNNNLALASSPRQRCYWVVSPNVKPQEKNVEEWKEASCKHRAAFMGWGADDPGHCQIGPKFAGETKSQIPSIKHGDIILIARGKKSAETVGFGVVRGKYKWRRFEPSSDFVSVRYFSKFKRCPRAPSGIPLLGALQYTRALAQLDRDRNSAHKKICEWLDRKLGNKQVTKNSPSRRKARTDEGIGIVDPPENHKSGYEVQTKNAVINADKVEAKLLDGYRDWLKKKGRELKVLDYNKRLQCDGFEVKRRNLIEAKASARRENIRMAVGQLLDYAFLGREDEQLRDPKMAILLPKKPHPDIVKWLKDLNISIIWRQRKSFSDNAKGWFTIKQVPTP